MSALPADRSQAPLVRAAMSSVVVLLALQVASRATRDTLFLSHFPVSALPEMIGAAALASILAALAATRALTSLGPQRFVTRAFLVGALLMLIEWLIALRAPGLGAVLVYLHVVALGPVLLSGFWSLVNERFDPRAAKRALGRIAAVGTLGGLAGGLLAERLAERFGVVMLLPALAIAHAWCAWSTARLAPRRGAFAPAARPANEATATPTGESYRRLAATPYLRNLALLVLGSALSAVMIDFVFKAQVAGMAANEYDLMRAFSYFYAGVALLTFAIQALVSRPVLEHAGIARTMGVLPGALVAGGTVAALLPGPWTIGIVRGLEAVLRGSLFRAGYELLYTPIPPAEKRASRILIDVGCDRLGDLGGAVVLAVVLAAVPQAATPLLLVLAVLLSAATLGVVIRVQRGYVSSLEAGLRAGALRLDPAEVEDKTTWLTLQGTRGGGPLRSASASASGPGSPAPRPAGPALPDVSSGEGAREAIALLADDRVARRVVDALVPVAATHLPLLVEALLDPATNFATRRRIPAVLVTLSTARSADGLTRGLADSRFEVRYRCGRALAHVLEHATGLWVDGDRVIAAVRREGELGRTVWESQRLLDQLDESSEDAFVDAFLRDRAGRSLEHVFTLLSLVLEREPLRIAFRGLFSGDRQLRGTALEYLDLVLPPSVHAVLWPYLEPERARPRTPAQPRDREQVLGDLLRSNRSIEISLDALRRQRPAAG
ncbi:MAG: hypothetical protein ABIP29_08820 [Candidatus Eisenbacteria bacterium]